MPQVDAGTFPTTLLATVQNVWQIMLRRPAAPAPELRTTPLSATGTEMFTAWSSLSGAWTGSVHLHCDRAAANAFSTWMLNDTAEPLRDDDLADCLAELCNVLCGNLKTALPGPAELGLPGVIVGEDYRLQLPGGQVLARLAFTAEDHRVDVVVVQQTRT